MKWVIGIATCLILGLAGIVLSHGQGGHTGSAPATNSKVATISHGENVAIKSHLQEGTWTVVEFTADW